MLLKPAAMHDVSNKQLKSLDGHLSRRAAFAAYFFRADGCAGAVESQVAGSRRRRPMHGCFFCMQMLTDALELLHVLKAHCAQSILGEPLCFLDMAAQNMSSLSPDESSQLAPSNRIVCTLRERVLRDSADMIDGSCICQPAFPVFGLK